MIELLVVIAIIGILSAVVLASLNTARSKGSDATVKSNLANARSQAELFYYANTDSYDTVCTNVTVGSTKSAYALTKAAADAAGATYSVGAVGSATVGVCNDDVGAWAAQAPLKSPVGFFCVDSTGKAATSTTNLITTTTDTGC